MISVRDLSKEFKLARQGGRSGIGSRGVALETMLRELFPLRSHRSSTPTTDTVLRAVDGVSFDVERGEVLGIIGRNGAGKSTLLKILGQVLRPTAGHVEVRGRVVPLLELGVGFAPDLSASENIQFFAHSLKVPRSQIEALEDDILRKADLLEFRDVPLEDCPSGSFIQLVFAAMLTFPTEVLLADEVLAVGDAAFRQRCEQRIAEIAAAGGAVLLVSHDMGVIRRCCSRLLWLDQGRIRLSGDPDTVIGAYRSELLSVSAESEIEGEICEIKDVRLLNADCGEVGAFQMSESGFIEALIQARCACSFDVVLKLLQADVHVLTDRHGPVTLAAGQSVRVRAAIPADLLNEGQYDARCVLADLSGSDRSAVAGEATLARAEIVVRVFNSSPELSVWADWRWGRPGLISPRAGWNVERIRSRSE
ncbi:Teichoic acids export ATP-binding protein TagH [Blastochloris viridis]|uniref:Teichoic acids export ATP-binding protein TagH n=1 Tax=Blastochloris viridis TaxID=1079 RepID=A0A0S4Q1K8_BLAVI|nr:Teichoic acids export ATP-binding protein TagH [Blastochloris viridis]